MGNLPPMEWLATVSPDIFEATECEAKCPDDHPPDRLCQRCGDVPSASGWGNPSCLTCGNVDQWCMPFSEHLFCDLVPIRACEEDTNDEDIDTEVDPQSRRTTIAQPVAGKIEV